MSDDERQKAGHDAYIRLLKSYIPPDVLAKVDEGFFTYGGYRDWWRFPLVYPYSISMVDRHDSGGLEKLAAERKVSKGGYFEDIVTHVSRLAFDGKFMISDGHPGAWTEGDEKKENATWDWVVFEFATERIDRFKTEQDAMAAALARGYTGKKELEPLDVHSARTFGP